MKASRPHDESVVKLLKDDPGFAAVYLGAALRELGRRGGVTVTARPAALAAGARMKG